MDRYTSYVETGRGPDQYDMLAHRIRAAGAGNRPVHVLVIPRGDYDLDKIREACSDIPEVHSALDVNGTIDIIVSGERERAEEVGKRIFQRTGQSVGCVRYSGESMTPFYLTLKDAIRAARESMSPVHTYDPSKDSVSARIKRLREELASQK